ncbi:glucose PTS transporter subunit EIIB [Kitasatospora sp. LaBMicrA B282]|uniref:glucose PTS transporter subunit EIIB n=1 Tax=Kitasatospora sp. LaBMicrA B282 TaxID=3420949 RepID=UPI003D0C025E
MPWTRAPHTVILGGRSTTCARCWAKRAPAWRNPRTRVILVAPERHPVPTGALSPRHPATRHRTPQDGRRQSSRTADTEGEGTMATKAEKIVAGLGGIENIEEVEGCITRLRTEVKDPSLIDEAALKAAGAHGVVKMGTAIQVVIGTDADPIAADIEDMM